jgi:hypothetical protein
MAEIIHGFLAFLLLLCGCSPAVAQGKCQIMDCTQKDHCSSVLEEKMSPWSREHEVLYWKGVEEIVKSEACEKKRAMGLRLAYQAERRFAVSCDQSGLTVPYLKETDDMTKAFRVDKADYVVRFRKVEAWTTARGIQVQLSVSYFGKPVKEGLSPILEEIDTYVIVLIDKSIEARLVSRLAT